MRGERLVVVELRPVARDDRTREGQGVTILPAGNPINREDRGAEIQTQRLGFLAGGHAGGH